MSRATLRLLAAVALLGTNAAAAQALERRVAAAPDGQVRLSFAVRDGVIGNGRNITSWDCRRGHCNSTQFPDIDDVRGRPPCDSGPARVALRVRGGKVGSIRVYVGGTWAPASGVVTDLGTVPASEAARYLLTLDLEHAVFAATLADSVTIWPDLLRLARNPGLRQDTRRQAVFWLGHAAGEAATRGLDELVDEDGVDREVRTAAVFALSQRPRDEGVPVLIRIATTNRDAEIRRQAIFWLGQSEDPRALALFEELLTRP